jgi:hypothetical protein
MVIQGDANSQPHRTAVFTTKQQPVIPAPAVGGDKLQQESRYLCDLLIYPLLDYGQDDFNNHPNNLLPKTGH